jgi:hypothetical protein
VERERGVDHGRRVARLGPPRVDALDVEDRIGDHDGLVPDRAGLHPHELSEVHALGRHDIVHVTEDGRVAVGGVGELVQREIRLGQLMVRAAEVDRWIRVVGAAGIQLVDGAGVGARAEMAGRAGLHAVTSHLHVPEEGLAERDGDFAVAHVGREVGRVWRANALERSRARVVVREELLRGLTGALSGRLGSLGRPRAHGQAGHDHPYRKRDRE